MSAPITHARIGPRRSNAGGTWWSKAVLRAVEEAAFGEKDLRRGRSLARAGAVGAISVEVGRAFAAVTEKDDTFTVELSLPPLDDVDAQTFVEVVAAQAGRIGALLAGQLPHDFVEAVEEVGVELLPYGGELGAACTCEAWLDPCPHALAVWTQIAWLIQDDPFVLTHLRGLPREEMLQQLHAMTVSTSRDPSSVDRAQSRSDEVDLDVALEAAARAGAVLALIAEGRASEVAL